MATVPVDDVRPLAGYTVGITADERGDEQADLLSRTGAHVIHGPLTVATRRDDGTPVEEPIVSPHGPGDDGPARRLIAQAVRGHVDALTFTSVRAAVHAFELSDEPGALARALCGPVIAVAAGSRTAAALRDHGARNVVEPGTADPRAVVRALTRALSARSRRLSYRGTVCRWQGSLLVHADGEVRELTAGEQRLLRVLADRAPGVIAKDQLGVEGVDEHAVESAIARLRAKLGPLGPGIRTVRRRGYGCDLHPQPLPAE